MGKGQNNPVFHQFYNEWMQPLHCSIEKVVICWLPGSERHAGLANGAAPPLTDRCACGTRCTGGSYKTCDSELLVKSPPPRPEETLSPSVWVKPLLSQQLLAGGRPSGLSLFTAVPPPPALHGWLLLCVPADSLSCASDSTLSRLPSGLPPLAQILRIFTFLYLSFPYYLPTPF